MIAPLGVRVRDGIIIGVLNDRLLRRANEYLPLKWDVACFLMCSFHVTLGLRT